MIKNNLQAQRVEIRIKQLEDELDQVRAKYPDIDEQIFWGSQLEDEINELAAQLDEYKKLCSMDLVDAVNTILQEPVLLENIGELLAKLRIASNYTQEEMANILGWRQSNLSRFESDRYSSQTIGKISEYIDALGVWLHVYPWMNETRPDIKFTTGRIENSTHYLVNPFEIRLGELAESTTKQRLFDVTGEYKSLQAKAAYLSET